MKLSSFENEHENKVMIH